MLIELPAMTHPLGKRWRQPAAREILVDDEHALMTESSFNKLSEYNSSLPSGVYDGKMWRRRYITDTGECAFSLCWYGPSNHPGKCSINSRRILIV